jgi:SAM-dependent methyltransferase
MIRLPFMRRPTSDAGSEAPAPTLDLGFPDVLAQRFPETFDLATRAADDVLAATRGADFTVLARRSPGLHGYDWCAYIRCSVIRMVNALEVLRGAGVVTGRILDYGAYFGNMALFCRLAGYEVAAADGYRDYGDVFDGCRRDLRAAGIEILDFADVGLDLRGIGPESFDAVLALGVIEHVPHTPRGLLESLNRVLRPGGVLVLDTPNLAYLYTRERLARGETVFLPIEQQYETEVPFEGHHREYTPREIRWMLERLGHSVAELRTFNYSLYASGTLTGDDVARYRAMERDPELREIILAASIKPARV